MQANINHANFDVTMSVEWDLFYLSFNVANYESISHNARWRHGAKTLSSLLAFCKGNQSVLQMVWNATTLFWRHSKICVARSRLWSRNFIKCTYSLPLSYQSHQVKWRSPIRCSQMQRYDITATETGSTYYWADLLGLLHGPSLLAVRLSVE